MARTIADIKKQMEEELVAQQVAGNLTNLISASQVAVYKLWIFIVAVTISIFEQLQDVFKTELEDFAATVIPMTASWIQRKVFEFQYDATTPQVLTLIDFVPSYATVDESKRIASRCSVETNTNKTVQIKVATGATPTPFSGTQLTALDAYLDLLIPAGVGKNVISLVSDKLWLDAEIFYNGQYAATIQADVINALNTFLSEIPFNGVLKISSIEDAIQAVPGVTDVVITEARGRDDATPFSGATTFVKEWLAYAGYIVQETTSGETFSDKLIFTSQN